jgi:hypothetical protein
MLQIVLLVGKFAFLIILYLFIYKVVRSATREMRAAAPCVERQPWPPGAGLRSAGEEFTPAGGMGGGGGIWTLVVQRSPSLAAGTALAFPIGTRALAGRSSEMDIQLDDTFVSSKHALFESTGAGFRVEDLRSTNGTQVNGADILRLQGA